MCIVIESPAQGCATQIANAFSNPAFPLTAGQSDSILYAVSVTIEELEMENTNLLQDVLVFQEMSPNYNLVGNLDSVPLFESIVAPTIQRIATAFSFDESGHRTLASRELVTFVGNQIEAAEEVSGYAIQTKSRFFHSKKDARWVIPVHRFG